MSMLTSSITNKTKSTLDVLVSLRASSSFQGSESFFIIISLFNLFSPWHVCSHFNAVLITPNPANSRSCSIYPTRPHMLPTVYPAAVLVHRAYPLCLSQKPSFIVPYIEFPPSQIGFCPLDFWDGPNFCFLHQVKGYLEFTSTWQICCVWGRHGPEMSPMALPDFSSWLLMGCWGGLGCVVLIVWDMVSPQLGLELAMLLRLTLNFLHPFLLLTSIFWVIGIMVKQHHAGDRIQGHKTQDFDEMRQKMGAQCFRARVCWFLNWRGFLSWHYIAS